MNIKKFRRSFLTITVVLALPTSTALAAPAVATPGEDIPRQTERDDAAIENINPTSQDTAVNGARFTLRNLRDIPSIEANAVLALGEALGTSKLTVNVSSYKPRSYVLYAENYGSQAAGRYRYGLQADWKNLGGTGSKLSVGALVSNSNQHGGNISYEAPVGHSMTTLGLGYSHSDYELGSVWRELGVEGESDTFTFYGKTPLVNTFKMF
ncbi:MAG: hypothetical protein IJ849_04215 [Selenomonadaceae bacterium]|nr:hypothetical protein [Selenomonadaceae bacterium]